MFLSHNFFHYIQLKFYIADIDGGGNSIYEINYASYPEGKDNPKSNAYIAQSTLLASEESAKRRLDLPQNRRWKIVNPNKINKITGAPVGYVIGMQIPTIFSDFNFYYSLPFFLPHLLEPGGNTVPYARAASPVYKRANYVSFLFVFYRSI